jgi:hypothetical protein
MTSDTATSICKAFRAKLKETFCHSITLQAFMVMVLNLQAQ